MLDAVGIRRWDLVGVAEVPLDGELCGLLDHVFVPPCWDIPARRHGAAGVNAQGMWRGLPLGSVPVFILLRRRAVWMELPFAIAGLDNRTHPAGVGFVRFQLGQIRVPPVAELARVLCRWLPVVDAAHRFLFSPVLAWGG